MILLWIYMSTFVCIHTLSILHDLPSLWGIANAIEYQHHGAHDNGIIVDGQQVAFYQETDAKRENLRYRISTLHSLFDYLPKDGTTILLLHPIFPYRFKGNRIACDEIADGLYTHLDHSHTWKTTPLSTMMDHAMQCNLNLLSTGLFLSRYRIMFSVSTKAPCILIHNEVGMISK